MTTKRPTGRQKATPGSWGALADAVEAGDQKGLFEALVIVAHFLRKPEPPDGLTLSLGNTADDNPGADYVRFVRAVERYVGALVQTEVSRLRGVVSKRQTAVSIARNTRQERAWNLASKVREHFGDSDLTPEQIRNHLVRNSGSRAAVLGRDTGAADVPSTRSIQRYLNPTRRKPAK